MTKDPAPQVPAMATSGASGQNVEADRAETVTTVAPALCDERPAGGSDPAVLDSLSACACMGPRPGDEYCYCELKARGMSTKHYEWTEEEKQKLTEALKKVFGAG